MADQTYDTPNGPKTLAQMQDGLRGAGWGGNYDDPASVIAAYNQTASGSGSKTGGSGNPAQDLLDAIASGDQQKFDEAVKEYQQTSSTNLATSLLGTASQLGGPENYDKFVQYTSGGRNLWEQLFGNQPRPDFSAPTGPITPETITTLLQRLGMIPATPAPTSVNPQAPAGSVPVATQQNVSVTPPATPAVTPSVARVTPTAPTTPLSGVAASVGATPAVTPQAVVAQTPTVATTPAPAAASALPTQTTGWGQTAPTTPTPTTPTGSATSQKTPSTITSAWQNPQQPIPLPYQINPAVWDSLGPVGQQLALSAAEAAGWDKNEYLRQINAARPQGTAPGASSTAFKTAVGAFS